MKSLVLFNNKGGVGKTTLTYNLAHMIARQGHRTVVLDYDPQCNLSGLFLSEDELAMAWDAVGRGHTVADCIDLVRRGKGDVRDPHLVPVAENLWLLPGHLDLSRFEQTLAEEWGKTGQQNNERALDVVTALDVLSNRAAETVGADVVLFDVGPSLGALNRSALLACDAVIMPLAPDLFSLQGLRNAGPTLLEWREDWQDVRDRRMKGRSQQQLPPHQFQPLGYIVQQHLARADRPVTAYQRWTEKIPNTFREFVLDKASSRTPSIEKDRYCLALLKHYASLVPLAQLARKPIFDLKQADGAGGGQLQAVVRCRQEFHTLADRILSELASLPAE